jgi:catechol 2,3-dioxygenase-like lactoylglutathione lyase family enzyme
MADRPMTKLTAAVLDSSDALALANFYHQLFPDWVLRADEPGWATLRTPDGAGLSFATESGYVRPTWPTSVGEQQMMLHLDIEVDDLDAAGAIAVAAGAVLADFQPQDDVRVYFDPDGHPFCLWIRT